jgi:hypothetical protein
VGGAKIAETNWAVEKIDSDYVIGFYAVILDSRSVNRWRFAQTDGYAQ